MSYFIRSDIYAIAKELLAPEVDLPDANLLPQLNLLELELKLKKSFSHHPLWQKSNYVHPYPIPHIYVIVDNYQYWQQIFSALNTIQQNFATDFYNPYNAHQHLPSRYRLAKAFSWLKKLFRLRPNKAIELKQVLLSLAKEQGDNLSWWKEHVGVVKSLLLVYLIKKQGCFSLLPLVACEPGEYIPVNIKAEQVNDPTLELYYDQEQGYCLKTYAWYNSSYQKLEKDAKIDNKSYAFSLSQIMFAQEHPESRVYQTLGSNLASLHALGISLGQGNNLHSWVYNSQRQSWTVLDLSKAKLHLGYNAYYSNEDIRNLLDQINITNQIYMGYFFYEDWQVIAKGYEE